MKRPILHSLNFASSMLGTILRTGTGISVTPAKIKPEKLLKLYEFEACPYCRLVREALTELDLDAEIYPCPKGGERYRPYVKELGGKAQFPFLVDPNNDTKMYESFDIIKYLFETYGQRSVPLKWQLQPIHTFSSSLVSTARIGVGKNKKPSTAPEQLLELYSFESSPFARLVRDTLCELEIPYILRNCGRTELGEWLIPPVRDMLNIHPQSKLYNRIALQEKTGRMSIPYLIDPNNDVAMFEAAEIVEYLQSAYGSTY
ncbi:MAG: glutathione S-transferase N-terminal domain-containing protein [Aliiglaciecola sp.]